MAKSSFLDITRARTEAIHKIAGALKGVNSVAVTTHINADGDAAGSVAAMARLLPQIGSKAVIVNPTPWPPLFGYLKDGLDDQTSKGAEASVLFPTSVTVSVYNVVTDGDTVTFSEVANTEVPFDQLY